MKVLLTFAIVLVTIFAVTFAADCDVNGHKFNKGESHTPKGQCITIKCNGVGSIHALGCAAQSAPPHCKRIPQDLSKPYPQCCPKWDCSSP